MQLIFAPRRGLQYLEPRIWGLQGHQVGDKFIGAAGSTGRKVISMALGGQTEGPIVNHGKLEVRPVMNFG